MSATIRELYADTWRAIFSSLSDWSDSRIEEFINHCLPEDESEPTGIFHELPSTWAGWALFPLCDDARLVPTIKATRNKFFQLAHALHGGQELEAPVDWTKIRPAYMELVAELERFKHCTT